MEAYITTIVEAMASLSGKNIQKDKATPISLSSYKLLIKSWMPESKVNFSKVTKIHWDLLPPEQMLDDDQVDLLCGSMVAYLNTMQQIVSLSLAIPIRDKYTLLRDFWETFTEFDIADGGFIHDFLAVEEVAKYLKNNNASNPSTTFDHFYTLDPSRDYPTENDDEDDAFDEEFEIEYNLEEMWQSYEPLAFCASKYVEQLVSDLESAAKSISPSGVISIVMEEDDESLETNNYQPIAKLLSKEVHEFPVCYHLSIYEADAISQVLMKIFDSSFFNEYLPFQDPFTRYRVLKDYLMTDVGFISPGNYLIRPLTQEEAEEEERKVSNFMDKMFGNIDFDKLKDKEDDDIDDDELPF